VCTGALELAVAQRDIAVNWIAAYQKYFRTTRPVEREAAAAAAPRLRFTVHM
jgi:hypothetical protein